MRRGDVVVVDLEPVWAMSQQATTGSSLQVRAISVERVGGSIGRLSPRLLARLDDARRLHLGLSAIRGSSAQPAAAGGERLLEFLPAERAEYRVLGGEPEQRDLEA